MISTSNISVAAEAQCNNASSLFEGEVLDELSALEPGGSSRRKVCEKCDRPASVCLCSHLPPSAIEIKTKVIILQHPHEARQRLATVPLLARCLATCHVIRGRRFFRGSSPLLDELLGADSAPRAPPVAPGGSDPGKASSFAPSGSDPPEVSLPTTPGGSQDPDSGSVALPTCHVDGTMGACSGSPQGKASRWQAGGQGMQADGRLSSKVERSGSGGGGGGTCSSSSSSTASSRRSTGSSSRRRAGNGSVHRLLLFPGPGAVDLAQWARAWRTGLKQDRGGGRLRLPPPEEPTQEGGGGRGPYLRNERGSACPEEGDREGDEAVVLVVMDGTWQYAREMLQASLPFLREHTQLVCLPYDPAREGSCLREGGLLVRKEPKEGFVSTMEAVARALGVLEENGAHVEHALLLALGKMASVQAGFSTRARSNSGSGGGSGGSSKGNGSRRLPE